MYGSTTHHRQFWHCVLLLTSCLGQFSAHWLCDGLGQGTKPIPKLILHGVHSCLLAWLPEPAHRVARQGMALMQGEEDRTVEALAQKLEHEKRCASLLRWAWMKFTCRSQYAAFVALEIAHLQAVPNVWMALPHFLSCDTWSTKCYSWNSTKSMWESISSLTVRMFPAGFRRWNVVWGSLMFSCEPFTTADHRLCKVQRAHIIILRFVVKLNLK